MLPVCLKCEDWDAPEMFDIRSILIKGEIKRCCDTLKKQESGFLHGCEGRRGPQEESFSKKGVMEMFDARTWVLNLKPDCPSPEDLDQLSLPTMCNYCPQASLPHRASLPLLCSCP